MLYRYEKKKKNVCAWLGHQEAGFSLIKTKTYTKTFHSKSEPRRFVTMEPNRSEDVSSRVEGISLIANWLPLDSYLCPGTRIFWQIYQKILYMTYFFLEQLNRPLKLRGGVGYVRVCGLSRSTIFQSCWDGAITFWVFTSTLGSLKCLAQGHYTGFEPGTSSPTHYH